MRLPASADIGGNGLPAPATPGSIGVSGFPAWYSDGTTKLSLCATGPGCVSPLTDGEAFYFHANATDGANLEAYEAGLEAVQDTTDTAAGCTPATPCNFVIGALRFRLRNLTPGALYTIQHPYGVNVFTAQAGA